MPRSPTARLPTGPSKPRIPSLPMRIWDAPTRLFHWTLVLLVAFSYLAIQMSWMKLHFLSGYTILALLLFRLAWGVVGSETARFSHFLQSPLEAFRHLAHFLRREPDTEIGHNAAGGWMVLVMLLTLLAQVATGLFSNDDVAFEGPLAHRLDKAASDAVTSAHGMIFNVILVVVALHVLAVIAYAIVKRHDLVRPMVTGKKRLPATMQQPRFTNPLLALLILIASACLVWLLVAFG
jgi:cytochrome b